MIIREAEEKDIPALVETGKRIHGFNPETELPFYSDSMGFELYVMENDDALPIAFLCARFDDDTEAEIDYIAIKEEYEGKGLASQFLGELLAEFKNMGIEKVFLEVRSRNAKAISLYERNGFSQYRIRKNYYVDDDAICYVKEIEK